MSSIINSKSLYLETRNRYLQFYRKNGELENSEEFSPLISKWKYKHEHLNIVKM